MYYCDCQGWFWWTFLPFASPGGYIMFVEYYDIHHTLRMNPEVEGDEGNPLRHVSCCCSVPAVPTIFNKFSDSGCETSKNRLRETVNTYFRTENIAFKSRKTIRREYTYVAWTWVIYSGRNATAVGHPEPAATDSRPGWPTPDPREEIDSLSRL